MCHLNAKLMDFEIGKGCGSKNHESERNHSSLIKREGVFISSLLVMIENLLQITKILCRKSVSFSHIVKKSGGRSGLRNTWVLGLSDIFKISPGFSHCHCLYVSSLFLPLSLPVCQLTFPYVCIIIRQALPTG